MTPELDVIRRLIGQSPMTPELELIHRLLGQIGLKSSRQSVS